jgi:hypothetical protein
MMMYGGGDKPKKDKKPKRTKCRKVNGKMVCTPKKPKLNKKTGKYS